MAEATKRAGSNDDSSPVRQKKIKKTEGVGDSAIPPTRILNLHSVPLTWGKDEVDFYVKENTKSNEEIYKGLQYIYFKKNPAKEFIGKICSLRFASDILCRDARNLLKKVRASFCGHKIWVQYDKSDNSTMWTKSDKPDVKAMKARNNILQRFNATSKAGINYRFNKNNRNWQENYDNFSYPPPQEQENGGNIFKNNMVLINQDLQDTETYGLSTAFLDSLGLTPPLTTKIFIDNLSNEYDDENKMRNLFSHAGTVASIAVITRVNDILKLKVEFDHPVEAVQAITMFHDREVYGKKLIAKMDFSHNAYKRFLPPGLKSFGPGLGNDGLPIKNVRNTIELQKAINMIMNEIASLKGNENYQRTEEYQEAEEYQGNDEHPTPSYQENNNSSIYSESQTSQSQSNTLQSQLNTGMPAVNSQNMFATLASSMSNPVVNNPLLALSALLNPQTTQMLQLLSQQTAGTNLLPGLIAPQAQVIPQPQASTGWNVSQPAGVQNTPGFTIPVTTNMQGQNMQDGLNMQGGQNIQSGPNMQNQNMPSGSNMQGGPNIQNQNMPSGPNMQNQNMPGGSNMPGGPNMHGGPNMQGGRNSDGPNKQGSVQGDGDKYRKRDNCTVVFSYLPPSVTRTALFSKMREVGEVRAAEPAGPGRAVVTFYSPRDAEACIKLLDHTKVDGQTIEVRYQ